MEAQRNMGTVLSRISLNVATKLAFSYIVISLALGFLLRVLLVAPHSGFTLLGLLVEITVCVFCAWILMPRFLIKTLNYNSLILNPAGLSLNLYSGIWFAIILGIKITAVILNVFVLKEGISDSSLTMAAIYGATYFTAYRLDANKRLVIGISPQQI